MTGIGNYSRSFLDTPEERYQKSKITAERFRIIQLGLVPFFADKDNPKKYTAKPYNIYIFPHEGYGNSQINCEVSAMIFNRSNNMDFNKWIYKGVQYLNKKQVKLMSESYEEISFNKIPFSGKSCLYKEKDIEKYNEFVNNLSQFLQDQNQKILSIEKPPKFFQIHIVSNIDNDIKKNIYISVDDSNMYFEKVSEIEREEKLKEEDEKKLKKYKIGKGVKNVFDAIILNKKPIIGHNFLLDILFCFSHFDELPKLYTDFKKLMINSFTAIYDTKIIYYNWKEFFSKEKKDFYDTSLESIYDILNSNYGNLVNINISSEGGFNNFLAGTINSDNINNNITVKAFHQAGYDSFITGCCFIYMKEALNDISKIESMNFKITFMKTYYNCFDFKNEEEFVVKSTRPYCLKSKSKIIDFQLENILSKNCMELIKKSLFIEGYNTILILLDTSNEKFIEAEKEIINKGCNKYDVLSIEQFKTIQKIEDEKKYSLKKKY